MPYIDNSPNPEPEWGRATGYHEEVWRNIVRFLISSPIASLVTSQFKFHGENVRGASAAIIVRNGKILLARRAPKGEEPLRWQFPGGEIDADETARLALYRELEEELGIRSVRARRAGAVQQIVGLKKTKVNFYFILGFKGKLSPMEGQKLAWVNIGSVDSYDLLGPNKRILARAAHSWDNIWMEDRRHYTDGEIRKSRVRVKLEQATSLGMTIDSGDIVVDIGAGSFSVADLLHEKWQRENGVTVNTPTIISVESSRSAIDAFRGNAAGKTAIIQAEATELPLRDQIATKIIAFNLIEHVEDASRLLSEMHRVLTPNGELLVCHSNSFSVIYIERLLKVAAGKWTYGYQRNLGPQQLRRFLERHEFKIAATRVDPPGKDRPILRSIDRVLGSAFAFWGRNLTVRAIRLERH
ncbi:NUDIX domain-containing protein [Nocardia asteroides]